jgi:signal transduction histidine kinase
MSGPSDRERPPRVDRASLILLTGIVVMAVVDALVMVTIPYRAPQSAVIRESLFAVAWTAVGVVALVLRRTLLARRILALSLVLTADFVGSFGLLSEDLLPRLLVTLTAILVPLQTAFAAHLLISYPTGRVSDRYGRRLVIAAYVLGGIQSIWWAFAHVSRADCTGCTRSLTLIDLPQASDRLASQLFSAAWALLGVCLVVLLVIRYRQGGQRQRRLLRLPYFSILVAAVIFVALSVVAADRGISTVWSLSTETLVALQIVSLLGVPLCFLISLLHERLAYRRIGELVIELAGGMDADLERSLAVALGDPQLTVVFPIDGGFVDAHGRSVLPPTADGRTTVTSVGARGAPMALIRHDRSLDEEPALLTAAGSATRLILENARLQAEVRAQLLEVRESRARLVTAANAARARLERDLHDGAQQRMLAIGLALQLLRQQPDNAALLDAAELELTGALAELRELAAGLHPAVLTDLGLVPALEALVSRLGPRVRIDVASVVRRCAPEVESVAYFSASEAITNAVKHAAPAPIHVTVLERNDAIVINVRDDGPGGADAGGSGLLGIRDRLASIDGTLTIVSSRGHGTDLTMEVPCD